MTSSPDVVRYKHMKLLSQLDPRWCNVKLGSTPYPIGRWGCYETSILNGANALNANPKGLLPSDLAANVANFNSNGDLFAEKICKQIGTIKFNGKELTYNPVNIAAALKDPRRFVILNVNGGAHFVLCWGKVPLFDDWFVADPLGGKIVRAKAKYHNVVGARYFSLI